MEIVKHVDETGLTPAQLQKLNKDRLELRTIIAGLRGPSRIERANMQEVKAMMDFVMRITGDDRKGMN